MSERLSDELVAHYAHPNRDWPANALAREVQEYRQRDASEPFSHLLAVTQTIDALCARHDITVEGIVALVDEVMKSDMDDTTTHMFVMSVVSVTRLRRLAQKEKV